MTGGPISEAFGLNRANYYVVPRVLLEAMPVEWQERWVAVQREIEEVFVLDDLSYRLGRVEPGFEDHDDPPLMAEDPLANYRHPGRAVIDGMRRREEL